MKINLQQIVFWVLVPALNFFIWFYFGKVKVDKPDCDLLNKLLADSMKELEEEIQCETQQIDECSPQLKNTAGAISVGHANAYEFEKYREERLASMKADVMLDKTYIDESDTMYVYPIGNKQTGKQTDCVSIDHHHIVYNEQSCFAVMYTQNTNTSYSIARIDQDIDIYGMSQSRPDPSQIDKYSNKFKLNVHNEGKEHPTGFFRKVPKDRGRDRLKQRLGPFLKDFDEINAQLSAKLSDRGIVKGDDVVVMVVNEGEIDLFLNFACSCRLHDISLGKVLVFAGSSSIVTLIEATGAMGLYHVGYASVSRKASTDYLDRVFVDMMWYKTFSVWLLLRRGINILFQDADLVWFRDPMGYFHKYIADTQARSDQTGSHPEAFFSDDGQRSMRYTPFYANSGFYYLLSTERSIQFTWTIMAAMDSIQVLGSHQNVFTTKLIEGTSISASHTKILSLTDFPTGIMYHHNRVYMQSLRDKQVDPFNFHM